MKPGDVYVGAIDLFAILLPGAIFTSVLASTSVPEDLAKAVLLLLSPGDSAARWVTFSLAAYALGHFVFLVSATLDNLHDSYRRWRWPDKAGNAYKVATQLCQKELKARSADGCLRAFNLESGLTLRKWSANSRRHEAGCKPGSSAHRGATDLLARLAAVRGLGKT